MSRINDVRKKTFCFFYYCQHVRRKMSYLLLNPSGKIFHSFTFSSVMDMKGRLLEIIFLNTQRQNPQKSTILVRNGTVDFLWRTKWIFVSVIHMGHKSIYTSSFVSQEISTFLPVLMGCMKFKSFL